jgi:uncharacterized membrane protein YczE
MVSARLDAVNARRLAWRFALLNLGLAIFALAMVLSLRSNLGANSWTVFHDGLSQHTPLTLGSAGMAVGFVILAVSWLLGIPPGFGTVMNMLMVGIWTDVFLELELVPEAQAYPARVALLVLSAVLLGLASAMYIKAGFGAGPRDAFMLAVTRRTNLRVGFIRWGMELTVVVIGILLGGAFGIGTILFALMVGPSVEFFFNLFKIPTRRARRAALSVNHGAD